MKLFLTCLLFCQLAIAFAQQNKMHQYGTIYTDCDVDTLALFGGTEEDLCAFFEQRVKPTHLITGDNDNSMFFIVLKLYFSPLGLLDSSAFQSNINDYPGKSSNIYLEKSIGKALEYMPPWSPAKKDGVAVASYVYLPLTFTDAGGWFDVSTSKIGYAEQKNQGFTPLKALLMVGVVVIIYLEMFVW